MGEESLLTYGWVTLVCARLSLLLDEKECH